MGNPMRIRATTTNGVTEVKALMSHPMETGLRKDPSGAPIPAHHIKNVTAKHNDKVVLAAEWGAAVSQNPFLQFRFAGGRQGQYPVDRQHRRFAHRRSRADLSVESFPCTDRVVLRGYLELFPCLSPSCCVARRRNRNGYSSSLRLA
jgi:sulfur-oxidizing protein SoxZ